MFFPLHLALIGGQMAASIAKQRLEHAMAQRMQQEVDARAADGEVIDVTARFIDDAPALPAPTARVQA